MASALRMTHMCISLRGALLNWNDREWFGCVTNAEGRTLTPLEVKQHFLDCLSEGKKGNPDGFIVRQLRLSEGLSRARAGETGECLSRNSN